jgi:dipeptide/tripeptide permease
MVVGGLLIAMGHTVLAGVRDRTARDERSRHVGVRLGLALIIIGTGHFKPCVSVMVGQLYGEDDARRDGAFTIFYMGINLARSSPRSSAARSGRRSAGTGASARRRSGCSRVWRST